MKKAIVLYNPLAHKGHGLNNAKKLDKIMQDTELSYVDALTVGDFAVFAENLPSDVMLIFTGGDGTLSLALNAIDKAKLTRPVYYFPAGSGNDFIKDLGKKADCEPFPINEYTWGMPTVRVNGITRKFINAIGYGMDGYCCEESDRLNALGKSKSYARIAMEGILGKYEPTKAKVTVDGVTKEYKSVWMAPTMFGSYYGGGFNMGPSQDRKNPAHTVTSVTIHDIKRIPAVFMFLGVMQGKGESMKDILDYRVGHSVTVEFDRPIALQIDGETVLNVLKYEVEAAPSEEYVHMA